MRRTYEVGDGKEGVERVVTAVDVGGSVGVVKKCVVDVQMNPIS